MNMKILFFFSWISMFNYWILCFSLAHRTIFRFLYFLYENKLMIMFNIVVNFVDAHDSRQCNWANIIFINFDSFNETSILIFFSSNFSVLFFTLIIIIIHRVVCHAFEYSFDWNRYNRKLIYLLYLLLQWNEIVVHFVVVLFSSAKINRDNKENCREKMNIIFFGWMEKKRCLMTETNEINFSFLFELRKLKRKLTNI